ncbi:MAG: hypothetical protein ACFE8J_18765 [Candidatus Heimdallarchaeota archaeon]
MYNFLDSEGNLKLLNLLCSGKGVDFNLSNLSLLLDKHRNTIKERTYQLIQHKVIDKPIYPFAHLINEYPLLVISKDEFIRDELTNKFIEKDPHIYAAFFFREEVYNTLTIQFHKDLHSYQTWNDRAMKEEKITRNDSKHPSEAMFFSTKRILKFDPAAPINIIAKGFKEGKIKKISGYKLDSLSINILKRVLKGKGIRTNENLIARELDINRKTVQRKIQTLLNDRIIMKPVSRFPRVIVPPDFILVLSLIESKNHCEDVESSLINDSHITVLIRANVGRYNLLSMGAFKTIEDHLLWQEQYSQRFPWCIGAIKDIYLSPVMTSSISQNYISLKLIEEKLNNLN